MGRKTIEWVLQTINWQDCARDDLDMAKKGKTLEKN